jgi:uncharacterized protein (DUF849 family)
VRWIGHHGQVLLKACLNGARAHTAPKTPGEVAAEGVAVVAAGARAIHVHPRGDDGKETLDGAAVAATLTALRAVVDVPIGVSTGAWFLPDPADRLHAIEQWTELPDFASVNMHEDGAEHIAGLLLDRGVGVEAGIWTGESARRFAEGGSQQHCLRILYEPMVQDVDAAHATVDEIDAALAGLEVPRLLHGYEVTAWAMLRRAGSDGFDARIGLEDTLTLPDGTAASGNAELVRCALELLG